MIQMIVPFPTKSVNMSTEKMSHEFTFSYEYIKYSGMTPLFSYWSYLTFSYPRYLSILEW